MNDYREQERILKRRSETINRLHQERRNVNEIIRELNNGIIRKENIQVVIKILKTYERNEIEAALALMGEGEVRYAE
jgi:aspartate/glutamate racemase